MKNEQLKTVEMVRRIRDRMYEETKDMAPEELLRYIQQRSEAASQKIARRDAAVARESSRLTHR